LGAYLAELNFSAGKEGNYIKRRRKEGQERGQKHTGKVQGKNYPVDLTTDFVPNGAKSKKKTEGAGTDK